MRFFFIFLLWSSFSAAWASTPPFHSSILPLSSETQKIMLAHKIWFEGCPVPLNDLRMVSVSYYDFNQASRTGNLILHKQTAPIAVDVFSVLYQRKFPIAQLDTMIASQSNWKLAEEKNTSYGFLCREKKSLEQEKKPREKLFHQESYGNVITLNPVQNPSIKRKKKHHSLSRWCLFFHSRSECDDKSSTISSIMIFPMSGMLALNRNIALKGMVEPIVSIFLKQGFVWSGQQTDSIGWGKFVHPVRAHSW